MKKNDAVSLNCIAVVDASKEKNKIDLRNVASAKISKEMLKEENLMDLTKAFPTKTISER